MSINWEPEEKPRTTFNELELRGAVTVLERAIAFTYEPGWTIKGRDHLDAVHILRTAVIQAENAAIAARYA